MKLRAALGVLAAAVTLTACGASSPPGGATGDGGTGAGSGGAATSQASSPTSDDSSAGGGGGAGGSVFCTNLTTAEQRLSSIEDSVGGGDLSKAKAAIDAEIGTFQQLSKNAPSTVKPALQDIVEILTSAKKTLSNPTSPEAAAGMQDLATKLPSDLAALGNYVANNCQGN